MKNKFQQILTGEKPLVDVWHYLIGNYRYKLYYSKSFKKLIRKHIFEQIKYRIEHMDRNCFYNGSCKMCGCETTALQMASKACEKPCYPRLMTRKEWTKFKNGMSFREGSKVWMKDLKTNKPLLWDLSKQALA